MSVKETITLYCKEGSSDKFYTASIVEENGKFSTPVAWGRRGTSGQTGFKAQCVSYDEAKKAYDTVVGAKMRGHSDGTSQYKANGTNIKPYAGTPTTEEKKVSLWKCQLLNPIEEEEVEKFLKDSAYCAQEKFDGKRMILEYDGKKVTATNKRGLECGFPSEYEKITFSSKMAVDGESIGENFHIFDLLSYKSLDLRGSAYSERYKALVNLGLKNCKISPIAVGATEKRILYEALKSGNREGIVFKRLDAPYTEGRPSSGGTQFKFKFKATASCIVIAQNQKSSIEIGLLTRVPTLQHAQLSSLVQKGILVSVGNCTIPANKTKPRVGQVVEIEYLYCVGKGGSLFQPVYKGERDDVDKNECKISQLKYKAEEE